MNATEIMALAFLLAVIGRWAHNESAVPSGKGLIEVVFALLVIAFLDAGRTAPIARGFAWLFLVAVVLSDKSPITGLAQASVVPSSGKPPVESAGGNPGSAAPVSGPGRTSGGGHTTAQ